MCACAAAYVLVGRFPGARLLWVGLAVFQARKLAYGLGLTGEAVREFATFATALYDAYLANDATLAEEMDKALRLLIESHDTQRKPVEINFVGKGKRRIRIGYIAEKQ